jgi:hypothetical protein
VKLNRAVRSYSAIRLDERVDNKSRVADIGGTLVIVLFVSVLSSCKATPETQVVDKAGDQELSQSAAAIRFFDLTLYLTTSDSLQNESTGTLSSGVRLNFAVPDSGTVRVSFQGPSGGDLRVYPDSLYPVPGSHPITISPSDTLADSLVTGIYTCRVLAGDSTFEKSFMLPADPIN